ncbi:hypothetical protein EC991_005686 [Linnemannia zychae]|nr:hypothetical protein EC991_005686 [Linnemannia zychae]
MNGVEDMVPKVTKKKRARKPVVKTTPRYMSESDLELTPEREVEAGVEANGVSGSAAMAMDDGPEDSPSLSPPKSPIVVVLPESSMLKPKLKTPSISPSPASSSPRVKQSQTLQLIPPTIKNYTPRRRLLLEEEEEEDEVFGGLALDTGMESVNGAAVELGPRSTATDGRQPAGKNLILKDNFDEPEEDEGVEQEPDWTFEDSAREAAWTVEKPLAKKPRSPEKTTKSLKSTEKDMTAAGKGGGVARTRATRQSEDMKPSTQTLVSSSSPPLPPAQEEDAVFLEEVRTTSRLLSKDATPRIQALASSTVASEELEEPSALYNSKTTARTRRLKKTKAPSVDKIAKAASPSVLEEKEEEEEEEEDPLFLEKVRAAARRLNKGKNPPRSGSVTEQHVDYNLVGDGTCKMTATVYAGDKEETDEVPAYQQHFGFRERKPFRMVDYVHVYDWMSPLAPVRAANNAVQQQIDHLSKKIDSVIFANQSRDLCCTECAGEEWDHQTLKDPRCPKCEGVIIDATTKKLGLQGYNEGIKEEIRNLRNGRHWLLATPFQRNCNWCGKTSSYNSTSVEEQVIGKEVYIKDVGTLPSRYRFDHEQKRLCLDCSFKCGMLLMAKRKFQLLYELSARIQPLGCVNCGIRESVGFRPDVGHVGLLCAVCSNFKEREGLDPEIPQVQMRIEELRESIANHSVNGSIRWDRIANDPRANPNFEFSAHGLLHRLIQHQSNPDQPKLSTYILLQHNHLTKRDARSQLYTCQARTPTQAALHFSRFVALYKKQPIAYLYIRKLEAWNIPTPLPDDWEDKTSGLQTFEELKQRVRGSVLKPRAPTQAKIQQLFNELFPTDSIQNLKIVSPEAGEDEDKDGDKDEHTTPEVKIDGQVPLPERLRYVPSDPPEPRFKQLPKWAQERARKVHQQTIQDDWLSYLHKRQLFYQSVGGRKPNGIMGLAPGVPLEEEAALLFAFCQSHEYDFSLENCVALIRRKREAQSGSMSEDKRLHVKPTNNKSRREFLLRVIEEEEKERASLRNSCKRAALPSAHDPTPMPSAQLPTHLVPSEYQVHVYQAILTAEARTVDVRLVRTERYKRQGDCLAGGGPIQIPKIIDRKSLRGFYREADRAKRYGSAFSGEGPKAWDDRTTIVLRADKSHGRAKDNKQGDTSTELSGVETWEAVALEKMIEMGIAEPIARVKNLKQQQESQKYAESLSQKPKVLAMRRKELCRRTGLSKKEVQILDSRLCTVTKELTSAGSDAQAAKAMAAAVAAEKEKEGELLAELPKEVTEISDRRVANELASNGKTEISSSSSAAVVERVRRERKRFIEIAEDANAVLRQKRQQLEEVEWIIRDVAGDQKEVEDLSKAAAAAIGQFSASPSWTVAPVRPQKRLRLDGANSQSQGQKEADVTTEEEEEEEGEEEEEESGME